MAAEIWRTARQKLFVEWLGEVAEEYDLTGEDRDKDLEVVFKAVGEDLLAIMENAGADTQPAKGH